MNVPTLESLYAQGRNIGDEYRYIIDRKYARKFAGNMLPRPSAILNPWAIRKTETGKQQAATGDHFGRSSDRQRSGAKRESAARVTGITCTL